MEPFFTTKGVGSGTGLGLSMAHGFAEQCGGRLNLKSQVGEGTTAELWLPVSNDDVAPGPDRREREIAGAVEKLAILAVDDDQLVLNNTAAILEDGGHRVLQAVSGRQALQILAEEKVDLLVTDYAMPEMTGAQLADAVRKGWPELPVLMVSGYAELPDGAAIGVPRLAKPFREDQLARAVRESVGTGRPSGRILAFRAR
jgi:CheY-like chemotaxis protein